MDTDSDSYEEDDDICIEDTKPKNPFQFKKEVDQSNDKYKDERFKYYGSMLPPHARTKHKVQDDVEERDNGP